MAPLRSTTLRLILALAFCGGLVVACSNDGDRSDSDTRDRSDPHTRDHNDEFAVPAGWETYTDADTGFRFAMPGEPEVIVDSAPQPDGGSIEVTMHVVESAQGVVFVGLGPAPSGYDLDAGVDRSVGEVGGTIIDRSATTVEGHDARDAVATFEAAGEAGLMLTRILVIDGTVVQLATIGADHAESELRSRHGAMLAGFEY